MVLSVWRGDHEKIQFQNSLLNQYFIKQNSKQISSKLQVFARKQMNSALLSSRSALDSRVWRAAAERQSLPNSKVLMLQHHESRRIFRWTMYWIHSLYPNSIFRSKKRVSRLNRFRVGEFGSESFFVMFSNWTSVRLEGLQVHSNFLSFYVEVT